MGEQNKLLLPFRDKTVLETVLDTLVSLPFREVLVVTGHDDAAIRRTLENYPARRVYNPDYSRGMSFSLKKGVSATDPGAAGFLVCLADMPLVTPALLRELYNHFAAASGPAIVVPVRRGRRGNPVIFSRLFSGEIMALQGDRGARSVIDAHPEAVVEVAVDDEEAFRDIDTDEDYQCLR